MGQYRIFSEPLGVDFMVEGPEAPNEESTFQILKQVVPPDRMIKAFEDGNKELARAAYKNGYFDQESDTGLYDAFKQAAGEVMEGLGDISKEVSLDFTASGAMTYGVPGSQKLVEGARAEQQKRRRKRKATGYQTMAEVFAGYKTIGDAGKLAFSKIAGEGDEDIDASIQFIGDMMKTQSFIDDGAAIMAEQFGDFDMYRDLKAGRVEPDKKQALAASLFVQLENPVAAVTTGGIRSTTNMLRRGTAKKLAEQFKVANSKKLLLEKQLNRLPANASDTLVKTATDALEKATKESDEILAKITPFTEQKAKAGFTNQMVGKGMQAVGKAGEHFGNLTEFIRRAGVEEATTLLMRAGMTEPVAKGVIYTAIGGVADISDGDLSATGTGFGALAAYMGPRAIASMGRSSAILGKQLTMAETTMPFFKRVGALPADDPKLAEVLVDRTDNLVLGDAASQLKPILTQTRDLPSSVRGAARFIDRSGLGRLGTETANVAKAAAGGAALPGAFGYMAGGEEGAASAIGASAPFIAAGLGYGSLLRFNNKSDLLAKQLGDLEYHKQSLTETERANFEKLDKDQQVAISTFSQFFPDVEIRMKSMGKDGPSGAHYVDGSDSVIEINTDTNLSYGTILSHEIGHHVERHGLLPNILEEMLGNPEKGRVGIFTKIDKSTGKPKITTDENGMKHYELTDEFRELQKAYVDKLANSNVSEKAKQAYETPEQFARELFAETVAERMLSGKTSKRAGQSSTYKLIESLGDRITSGGFMRKAMHSLGMATKADGSLVQGTGILGKPFKTSKQLDNLVKRYEDETIGLSESEIREQRPVTKDDELDTVIVSPSDPIESLQVFNNGGHFKTDKDGNIIVNPITKKPEVYSPSETKRANQALARDLTESIKARENDLPEGHVTLSETEDGKLTGSGKFIDDSIIDELSRTGRYNPSQINFLREASKAGREGIGNQMLLFYYAATGKGGRKYKTLKGGYRDSLVYGITITKDGNVILDTVSLDKLQKNIDYLLKRRGNEIGQAFGGSDPAVIRKNFESMFEKYLDNHAKGIVNGDDNPVSGITDRQRDFLNAAFGPVSKSQIADNPTLSNLGERRANTLGTYRSRRLDRIGTLNPTGNTRNIVIDRIRRNLMPGRSEADVQITDKLFMPASEAGAGKGTSALDILKSNQKPEGLPKVPTILEIAEYFKKEFGNPIDYKKSTPEQNRLFEDLIYEEVLYAQELHPEAAGWYDENLSLALSVLEELDPTIKQPDNNFIFKSVLAATSDGNKVQPQFDQTWATYNHWKDTGEISGKFVGGDRISNIKNNLLRIEAIFQLMGGEGAGRWLSQKGTIGEIRKAAQDDLGYTKAEASKIGTSELVDEVVPYAVILGPKLGSFFNNLYGDYSTFTMDRWFMRTVGRNTGTQVVPIPPAKLNAAKQRVRDAVNSLTPAERKKIGITKQSVAGNNAIKASTKLAGYFTKKQNRTGVSAEVDNLRRAANALNKFGKPLKEAPQNGAERRWLRERLETVQSRLRDVGVNLENADLQALLWYNEKEIYEKLGYRSPTGSADYAGAAEALHARKAGKPSRSYADGTGRVGEIGRSTGESVLGETSPQEINFLPAGNFSRQPANRITRQAPAMPGNRFMLPAVSAGAKSAERFR